MYLADERAKGDPLVVRQTSVHTTSALNPGIEQQRVALKWCHKLPCNRRQWRDDLPDALGLEIARDGGGRCVDRAPALLEKVALAIGRNYAIGPRRRIIADRQKGNLSGGVPIASAQAIDNLLF